MDNQDGRIEHNDAHKNNNDEVMNEIPEEKQA